jgi:hypothetical protein
MQEMISFSLIESGRKPMMIVRRNSYFSRQLCVYYDRGLYYDREIQKNGLQSRADVKIIKTSLARSKKIDRVAGNIHGNIRNWCNIPNTVILFRHAEAGTIHIV